MMRRAFRTPIALWLVLLTAASLIAACGPQSGGPGDNQQPGNQSAATNGKPATNRGGNTIPLHPPGNEPGDNAAGNENQPGPSGPVEADPAIPRPHVAIDLPEVCPPFEMIDATITITNVAEVPVMVFDIDVRPRDSQPVLLQSWFQQRPAVPLPGGGMGIRAAWLVEDPGPAARGPQPPSWSWDGEAGDLICTTLVLAPGEHLEVIARFRATYDLGDRLAARITAAPLSGDTSWLLKAGVPRVTHDHKPFRSAAVPGVGARWFEEMQVEIDFTPLAEPLTGGHGLIDIDLGNTLLAGNPRAGAALDIYQVGASAREFARRKPSTVMAATELKVGRCSPDIDEARKLVGVEDGPFERAIAVGMWAILDQAANDGAGVTWLVGDGTRSQIDGDALPLIKGMNSRGTQSVAIFKGSPRDDPPGSAGGQLAWFQAAGLAIRRSRTIEGTWNGEVLVEPGQLLELAAGLRDLGLRLNNTDAVPFR